MTSLGCFTISETAPLDPRPHIHSILREQDLGPNRRGWTSSKCAAYLTDSSVEQWLTSAGHSRIDHSKPGSRSSPCNRQSRSQWRRLRCQGPIPSCSCHGAAVPIRIVSGKDTACPKSHKTTCLQSCNFCGCLQVCNVGVKAAQSCEARKRRTIRYILCRPTRWLYCVWPSEAGKVRIFCQDTYGLRAENMQPQCEPTNRHIRLCQSNTRPGETQH